MLPDRSSKHSFSFDALGTKWWIELPLLPGLSRANYSDLESKVLDCVTQFEQDYSRFRPDSLLSQLNSKKSLDKAPSEMIDMLQFAISTFEVTGGVFNISVGGILEQRGYGMKPDMNSELSTDLNRDINFVGDKVRISQKTRLDFGGFGKGWLIDKIGRLLADNQVAHFIINGGGDILVSGVEATEIALEDPTNSSELLGVVNITNGALGVSSNNKRRWKKGSATYGHIVSDTTVDDEGVFVLSDSALHADVVATCVLASRDLVDVLIPGFAREVVFSSALR